MIENVQAMARIDAIMAVDGIDFVLFGPADYAMSLGLDAPKVQDQRVQAAIAATVTAAHLAGKYVALVGGTAPENIKRHLDLGIDMLELGNDLGVVRNTWQRAITIVADNQG